MKARKYHQKLESLGYIFVSHYYVAGSETYCFWHKTTQNGHNELMYENKLTNFLTPLSRYRTLLTKLARRTDGDIMK